MLILSICKMSKIFYCLSEFWQKCAVSVAKLQLPVLPVFSPKTQLWCYGIVRGFLQDKLCIILHRETASMHKRIRANMLYSSARYFFPTETSAAAAAATITTNSNRTITTSYNPAEDKRDFCCLLFGNFVTQRLWFWFGDCGRFFL